jgi:hypothetical protein
MNGSPGAKKSFLMAKHQFSILSGPEKVDVNRKRGTVRMAIESRGTFISQNRMIFVL